MDLTGRRPRRSDVSALIGLVAVLEGELTADLDSDRVPDWAAHLARRLTGDGLLAPGAGNRELRQALNDLNHRLRYVHGEYDEEPGSYPVP